MTGGHAGNFASAGLRMAVSIRANGKGNNRKYGRKTD
jgi:hypothetical protein